MLQRASLILGGLVVVCFTSTYAISAPSEYPTRICIERPGENGRVNITPVTIRLDGMAELSIVGEQEVCVGTKLDRDTTQPISLKFYFPYGGPGEVPRWWETKPASVSMKVETTTRILLCERDQNHNDPSWEKSGWHDMWILLPPTKRKLCAQ